MAVTGSLDIGLNFQDLISTATAGTDSHVVNKAYAWSVANGSGANQASVLWSASATLTATTTTYDLSALTGPRGTVTFTKVKGLLIYSASTTDGNKLILGNAGSNIWAPFLSSSSTTWDVAAGGIDLRVNPLAQASNAWTVDGTHKNLKLDAGAYTIPYVIIIWGI